MDDLKFWVAFTRIPFIGTARFRLLEEAFGSLEAAWTAGPADLESAGLDRRSVEAIVSRRPRLDPDGEMERLARLGVRAITWHHPDYPPLLKEVPDPPPVLFLKGDLRPEDRRAVAVVGTRRATTYGREACSALVRDLARAGVTIVSGLARGIDGIAHRSALEAGGRTLAVLACGLDIVYPWEHRPLAEEIVKGGALLSEFPPGTRPEAQQFPRRNRLLSGLSLGVLVVEAPEESGAMWTVHWALEQGREVFAVPGSIFSPASRGVHRLIQEGAKLVRDAGDILEELNLTALRPPPSPPPEGPAPALGEPEARLLRLLGQEPVHIDDLCRQAGLPITTVSSSLALMELRGLVKQVGGMHYIRARDLPVTYEATA